MPSLAYQAQAKALLAEHGVPVDPATANLLNTLWPASALTGRPPQATTHPTIPNMGTVTTASLRSITISTIGTAYRFTGSPGGKPGRSGGIQPQVVLSDGADSRAELRRCRKLPDRSHHQHQVLLGVNYFEQNYSDLNNNFDPISLGFIPARRFRGLRKSSSVRAHSLAKLGSHLR